MGRGGGAHVHDGDAGCVHLVDCPLWRDTDGAHEERGFLLDDDVDELGELSVLVVFLHNLRLVTALDKYYRTLTFVFRALPPTWGMRRSTPKGAFLSLRSALMARI